MSFLRLLLSRDENGADSIVLAVLLCILTLCAVSIGLAFADHATWSPMGFAGAAAAILTAGAGGKTIRDRLSCQPGESK